MIHLKKRIWWFSLTAILLLILSCSSKDSTFLANRYFGETPPGDIPVAFAPGIISGSDARLHGFPAFSPDGIEVYWPIIRFVDKRPKGIILFMKYENDAWTPLQEFRYSGQFMEQAPIFSPDGKRLYFQSARPGGLGSLDIWYVERTDSGWIEPKNLGTPVNSIKLESQPSFTKNGTIYFSGYYEKGGFNRGIYRSRLVDGHYSEPELLGKMINTEFIDMYPFIASDESYLLFSSSRPSMDEENIRLFLSFRTKDDSWTDPINLSEEMNFDYPSRFPYVTPDEKYLFFVKGDTVYWIGSQWIERLRLQK